MRIFESKSRRQMPPPLDRYHLFLKRVLTPPRLQHSVGVMRVMGELAGVYALDRQRAMTAGLLHDAAKDLELERQLALADQAGIKFAYPCERHPVYLHAPASASLVSQELGITDRLILDAISAHSFVDVGEHSNTTFSWCLRFADLLAPSQPWEGMRKLKDTAYGGRMEEAALLQCGWLLEYFEEKAIPVHPHLEANYQTLFVRLGVDGSFFERRYSSPLD
jgi:predicted HD superfamily hydrolase involved in NAD metabolism